MIYHLVSLIVDKDIFFSDLDQMFYRDLVLCCSDFGRQLIDGFDYRIVTLPIVMLSSEPAVKHRHNIISLDAERQNMSSSGLQSNTVGPAREQAH